jgi:hypothetical protein
MVLGPKSPEIAFAEFRQEVPEDYHELAYEFNVFTGAGITPRNFCWHDDTPTR